MPDDKPKRRKVEKPKPDAHPAVQKRFDQDVADKAFYRRFTKNPSRYRKGRQR